MLASSRTRALICSPARTAARPGGHPVRGLADRPRGHLGDRAARHRDGQDLRPQPGPAAGRAGHGPHVAPELLPRRVGLGFGVPPLDPGQHAFEPDPVGAVPAGPGAVADPHLLAGAVQHGLPRRLRQLVPGHLQAEAARVRGRPQQPGEVLPVLPIRPGRDRAAGQRPAAVRYDQAEVGHQLGAESLTDRARAQRRVERERLRCQLVQRQRVPVRAGQVLGEPQLPARVVRGPVDQLGAWPRRRPA